MRLLAHSVKGDPPLTAGESAVAGLAACLNADAATSQADCLTESSRLLVLSTEGGTDPEPCRAIVGP